MVRIWGMPISDLNPDDIESVSVLKGEQVLRHYMVLVQVTGVILITTRSGVKGKKGVGVSVNSSIVFDVLTDYLPLIKQDLVSGKAGAHILEEAENESCGALSWIKENFGLNGTVME